MSVENLKAKQTVIDEIAEKMEKASSVVVIDYLGTTVEQATAMRNKLRDGGVDYKVYKNTLVKRAIDGKEFGELAQVLDGPSAFAFGFDDVTAPARILNGVIKDYKKMEFKAGIIEGQFYDAEGIKQIADIPSRDELIAKFLGSIQSPIGKLVRTFAAIADAAPADAKAEAPAEAAPTAAPAEEAPAEAPSEEPAEAAEAPAEEAVAPEAPAEEAAPAEAEAPAEEAPAEEAAPTEAPEADKAE
ncbi:MAG: 50S ribosomal protein L10 [Clostridiales Family XIII bacterium]|jgi:large subunit ribosomal protein L10|nr:50S ribosomal protein L10 [Clostridiales Family XIII bacterium]